MAGEVGRGQSEIDPACGTHDIPAPVPVPIDTVP